jgi:hypothetical protein
MEVICIESQALKELIDQTVKRLGQKYNTPLDKWIDGEEAMRMLRIKSPTTLQKLRDEFEIEYSKINSKTIIYDRNSIDNFIERKKQKPLI